MKKNIVTIILATILCVSLSAQPRAIGGRLGYGIEASYQHTLGNNFVEADLGFVGFSGLGIAATYDFMIAQPNWTDKGDWGFYAGPGAALQFAFPTNAYSGAFSFGIGGQVGLEYVFENTPLQLSVDWRPMIGPAFSNNTTYFWYQGLYSFAIGCRYFF